MRLASEFIRLPLSFNVERLREEALQFSEYEWDYHPQRYDGNTALNLVSREGTRSDSYVGHMQPTEALEQCSYIKQVMASFGTVIGRSRFMRLAPGKGVPAHSDTDYTWRNRVRIHIPIVTDPEIIFSSMKTPTTSQVDVHMRAGEAWIFDNWREHSVSNTADIHRIHLVVDTVGTADFWRLAAQGWDPREDISSWEKTLTNIDYDPDNESSLAFEKYNLVPVRGPDEINALVSDFLFEIDQLQGLSPDIYHKASKQFREFCQDWRGYWALYLDTSEGITHYQKRIRQLKLTLSSLLDNVMLKSNGAPAFDVISNWLDLAVDESVSKPSATQPASNQAPDSYSGTIPTFDRPIFIVAAPRSGSTMLFETLKNNKELWSIGDESHQEIESIPELHPKNRGFESNRLEAHDCTGTVRARIIDAFMHRLQNSRSAYYADMPPEYQSSSIRFLEKTPKNALRIPFLKQVFPDAHFVFLYREARSNIGSMIDAWQSQKFVTYRDLPNWEGPDWSLLLTEGWQSQIGNDVHQIAAFQWVSTNKQILDDLEQIDRQKIFAVSYEALLTNTYITLEKLCAFMQVPFGPKMRSYAVNGFPNSKYVLTQPASEKWHRHKVAIESVSDVFEKTEARVSRFAM